METDQNWRLALKVRYLGVSIAIFFLSFLVITSQILIPTTADPGSGSLFGTDASGGNLINIDTTTGSSTIVGNMAIGPVPSLAVDHSTGVMYAGEGGGVPNIWVVDPSMGADSSFLGDTGLGIASVAAMDFRSDGTLFASVNIAGDGATGADHLAIIDKSTGAATVVGPFGTCTGVTIPSTGVGSCTLEGMEAIAFDQSDVLYGATSSSRGTQTPALFTIDPTTGQATMVAPILDGSAVSPSGGVVSLQFGCDATLFGGTATAVSPATDGGDLIIIDPLTGLFSTIGKATTGSSLGALAFEDPCPGSITVIKDTVPDGEQDFEFTSTTLSPPLFFLDDDTDPGLSNTETFSNLPPGIYDVTESSLSNFSTSVTCQDPDNGTTIIGNTANIDLDPGEIITCTYTNAQLGIIKIVKNTVPNRQRDFAFSTTGGLLPSTFSLDDDSDATLSNFQQYDNVAPGDYTVTEAAVSTFTTSVACSDPDNGTTTSGNTANIDLDNGETITCTYTNTKIVQQPPPPAPSVESPAFDNCSIGQTLDDPIAMNTITNGNIVKTIHAEKEVFFCYLIQGNQPVTVEVTTYVELFENIDDRKVLRHNVVVNTCLKQQETAEVLVCLNYKPKTTLQPTGTDCEGLNTIGLPLHPMEMNSIRVKNVVKTIETQKQIYFCELPDGTIKKVDIVLFTEIYQNINTREILSMQNHQVRCVVLITDHDDRRDATVESCTAPPILMISESGIP